MGPSKIENLKNETNISLSIQVRLDGFSFFTQNLDTEKIQVYDSIRFRENKSPHTLINRIEDEFENNPELTQEFKNVTVVYDNDLYTVVPEELFNSDHASHYLQLNTKILSTDFVAYDELKEQKKVVVYIPYANVNNYFFDKFGSFDYYHSSSLFLKYIFQKNTSNDATEAFAHIKEKTFDFSVMCKGELLIMNTFHIETTNDLLYHLLFVYEQLDLNPEQVQIELLGKINLKSDFYKNIYKYIRHCKIAPPQSLIFKKEDTLLSTLL